MTPRPSLPTILACAGTLAALLAIGSDQQRLVANPSDPFSDADGDLLPDTLEWVLLLDPNDPDTNSDGTDDFLDAVQLRFDPNGGVPVARAVDHEFRVMASAVPNAGGNRDVWIHFMFRFVGSGWPSISSFEPFIDVSEERFPLTPALGAGQIRMAAAQSPSGGMYARISLQLAPERILQYLMPCTIGVNARIDGRDVSTSTFLQNVSDTLVALVPISHRSVVVQPLSQDDGNNDFWTRGRVCVFDLTLLGQTGRGVWCEVERARCEGRPRLRCAPSCVDSEGQVIFIADGLQGLTGG